MNQFSPYPLTLGSATSGKYNSMLLLISQSIWWLLHKKCLPTESLCGKRKERIKMVDFTKLYKKLFAKVEQKGI